MKKISIFLLLVQRYKVYFIHASVYVPITFIFVKQKNKWHFFSKNKEKSTNIS